ncbi:MAG TPA: biopolymer transporter ExbD [Candidatus Acidoferrales bacterium]|nr:biopolymer transporter ExbD [Candidatus Acidoferrales bacterium]
MPNRAVRIRSSRTTVNCDLELRPLMNVFIVLIPMLLMSAVFMEIRVIEMSLPRRAASVAALPAAAPLELELHVESGAYVLAGRGVTPASFARKPASARDGAPDATTSAQLESALAAIVAAHPGTRDIKIVVESPTRYQEIVSLMDLARAAGLPEAGLEGAGTEGA